MHSAGHFVVGHSLVSHSLVHWLHTAGHIRVRQTTRHTRCRAIAGRTTRCHCKFPYASKFAAATSGFHCNSKAFKLNNSINHGKITVLNISINCLYIRDVPISAPATANPASSPFLEIRPNPALARILTVFGAAVPYSNIFNNS